MTEIRIPTIDPKAVEAGAEIWRRDMQAFVAAGAKGMALFVANLESFFRQASEALAELRKEEQ